MNDTPIINFEPGPGKDINLVELFRELRQRTHDRAKEKEELIKSGKFEYSQIWIMSKEQYEKLPENPTWCDMFNAGGIFQGWEWVEKGSGNEPA
jgi:hypothetical protein